MPEKKNEVKTYDTREEAEAAQRRGEVVDYSQVKGDDGLTDEERHLKKYEDRRKEEKEGDQPSRGSSSGTSSDETVKSDKSTKPGPQPGVPTTGHSSAKTSTAGSGAPSTGGSGKANQ